MKHTSILALTALLGLSSPFASATPQERGAGPGARQGERDTARPEAKPQTPERAKDAPGDPAAQDAERAKKAREDKAAQDAERAKKAREDKAAQDAERAKAAREEGGTGGADPGTAPTREGFRTLDRERVNVGRSEDARAADVAGQAQEGDGQTPEQRAQKAREQAKEKTAERIENARQDAQEKRDERVQDARDKKTGERIENARQDANEKRAERIENAREDATQKGAAQQKAKFVQDLTRRVREHKVRMAEIERLEALFQERSDAPKLARVQAIKEQELASYTSVMKRYESLLGPEDFKRVRARLDSAEEGGR